LVSKVPPGRIRGPVALANTSLTSQVLLMILLEEVFGVHPETFASPPNLPRMLEEAEAALLIGDEALRLQAGPPPGLYLHDLGEIWQGLTGLPMVFALWAARREFASSEPGLLKEVAEALRSSLAFALEHLEEAAAKAARWEPFGPAFLEEYFRGLGYAFGEEERKGLLVFAAKAVAGGFLSEVPELRLAEV
jgi:chorismate dehydratase